MKMVWHYDERQRIDVPAIVLMSHAVDDDTSALEIPEQRLPLKCRRRNMIDLIRNTPATFAKFGMTFHFASVGMMRLWSQN